MLAHNVFFTLKDDSATAREELVEACHKYLKDHPGVVFFAAGSLAEELDREVNDRDFHVGLHVVFENQEYQGRYQVAEKHLQFIAENKDNWEKVRVFASVVR
ncbi:MAG: Dabb family protein [Anaerohalosphaera sp.]|nr:Dabb family protein [Anaerohalosphaera sp.]